MLKPYILRMHVFFKEYLSLCFLFYMKERKIFESGRLYKETIFGHASIPIIPTFSALLIY